MKKFERSSSAIDHLYSLYMILLTMAYYSLENT